MLEFLFSRAMQKMVAVYAIFCIMSTADIHWDDDRWWCVLVLLFILEYLAYRAGISAGTDNLLSMERWQLLQLKDLIDRVNNGEDATEEELKNILKKEDKNADE